MDQLTNQAKGKSVDKSSSQNPLISVITVVFNGEEYLEKTIQSVVNQSYKNLEYIIIDGGSTDGTIEIIKKYEKKIANWISEEDKGIYDAMNKGIQLAKGELIGIVNSGDLYEKSSLKEVAQIYNSTNYDKQNLIISGAMSRFDTNSDLKFLQTRSREDLDNKINQSMPINHPATFVSKFIYEQIGYFNHQYQICGDYDFIFRAYQGKMTKFIFTDKVLAQMMMGGKSETFNTIWIRFQEDFTVRKEKIQFIPNILASLLLLINNLSKHFLMIFFGRKVIMYKERFQQKLKTFIAS